MSVKLKIAIQKSGRLHEDSVKLLRECGIDLHNGWNKLKTEASNFPMEIYFLRDDDIPQYVEDRVADIGIVGKNLILEKEKHVQIVEQLEFGKCRLSLAIPKDQNYTSIQDFQHKRIATSYPHILSTYLQQHQVQAEIHEISGSVEIAPSIGLADAICDLVDSGSTLFMNGLREVETILHSNAVLISSMQLNSEVQDLLEQLRFRIQAVKKAQHNKYILLNAPNDKLPEIIKLLPGMKSPTILPLAESGWSSVHAVINENDFWHIIESLKKHGAQGILVVPIEKMIV
ncbi:MAG: ATP phosphoribosyltransferase [Thermoflavifilum sp.]|nr:ATP phosphoribosyltransferase [Thermoflavifilum sp.]